MEKQSSDSPAKMPSPADFPVGSPESRAAARMMAANECKAHLFHSAAEAEAAEAARKAGLVRCPFDPALPFVILERIADTDTVRGH